MAKVVVKGAESCSQEVGSTDDEDGADQVARGQVEAQCEQAGDEAATEGGYGEPESCRFDQGCGGDDSGGCGCQ